MKEPWLGFFNISYFDARKAGELACLPARLCECSLPHLTMCSLCTQPGEQGQRLSQRQQFDQLLLIDGEMQANPTQPNSTQRKADSRPNQPEWLNPSRVYYYLCHDLSAMWFLFLSFVIFFCFFLLFACLSALAG